MPRVYNLKLDGYPDGCVYVGRPSKWGNPYEIGRDGTREQVLSKFDAYLLTRPDLVESAKRELAGRNLLCYCKPKDCHADRWLRIADNQHTEKACVWRDIEPIRPPPFWWIEGLRYHELEVK